MKRNMQMKRAGIPAAGMRPKKFKGWRNPHWREIRRLTGEIKNNLPVVEYSPCARIKER